MRIILIIELLLIFNLSLYTQNLVPNPSFEYYTSCPSGPGQLSFAIPWIANAGGEYLNSCSININYSVPNQGGYNFQYAHSGIAFIGLTTYFGVNDNYREYAHSQLLSILQANYCYYVEFYVNLASGGWGGKYAINNIACSFTNSEVNSTGNVLNLTPYIYKLGNPIINDTLNWVKISGIFQATGGEQYIVIGNFKDDNNTDTLNTGDGNAPGSCYFIDDVSVIPIDSINMPAYAGHDTSIILGDSVFIGQEITNLNCNWYVAGNLIASNISGLYVKPTESTTYIVEQNLCGTITYDTVLVKVNHVGITENETWGNDFTVYPNPNNGGIFVSVYGINGNNINIELSDICGKVIYSNKISLNNGVGFIKTDIPNGVYLLKITDLNSHQNVFKNVVIQH
jgi:hypothetical protein